MSVKGFNFDGTVQKYDYDSLDNKIEKTTLAPEFTPGKTYSAGDMVFYEGKLYSRKTDGTDQSWILSNWTETDIEERLTAVEEDVSDLKGDLDGLRDSNNLWKLQSYIRNGYIDDEGEMHSNSSWRCLYMIPVNGTKNIFISGYYGNITLENHYNITAFDINMEYLGGIWSSEDYRHFYTNEKVALLTDTAYICVVTASNMIDKCNLYLDAFPGVNIGMLEDLTTSEKRSIVRAINDVNTDVINANTELNIVTSITSINDLWGLPEFIKNGYIDDEGEMHSNSSWRCLYMIPVINDIVCITGKYAILSLENVYNITAFDCDGEYLGGVWKSTSIDTIYNVKLSLPSSTKYICIVTAANMLNYCHAYIALVPTRFTDADINILRSFAYNKSFSAFLKFGVVGDSLSVGYTGNDDQRNIEYSWGRNLARKYGNVCLNFGKSGATTKSWFTDPYCYTELIKEDNLCQAYIVGIGTNDRINESFPVGTIEDIDLSDSSNNADSFCGWYGKIIQTIKSVNQTAKIFCFTIPYPREDADKNTAIRAICGLFTSVYLVDLAITYNDLYRDVAINDFTYAGHFSPGGYANIADLTGFALSETMRNNALEFTEIDDIPFGNATIVN